MRGFVNRRDRLKWENVHYPDGETKVPGGDVVIDPETEETLTDALAGIDNDISGLDDRISVLENEFGNTGELLEIRSGVDSPSITGTSITITVEENRLRKGTKKK